MLSKEGEKKYKIVLASIFVYYLGKSTVEEDPFFCWIVETSKIHVLWRQILRNIAGCLLIYLTMGNKTRKCSSFVIFFYICLFLGCIGTTVGKRQKLESLECKFFKGWIFLQKLLTHMTQIASPEAS